MNIAKQLRFSMDIRFTSSSSSKARKWVICFGKRSESFKYNGEVYLLKCIYGCKFLMTATEYIKCIFFKGLLTKEESPYKTALQQGYHHRRLIQFNWWIS